MDVEELKKYIKVDGNDSDTILTGYQLAAEEYLINAGVAISYASPLYKIVVTMVVGTILENPSLLAGNGNIGSLNISLTSLIAQLRLSKVTA
jgi:uncharacterized phage protein (predicted DNA packaging)